MFNFASDNAAGLSPPILKALIAANEGFAGGYGNDEISNALTQDFNTLFEREVSVYLVSTGTAANSLALAALTPPHGVILTHEHAHIIDDECGAVELQTHGARLAPVCGQGDKMGGKITLNALEKTYQGLVKRVPHSLVPATLSLTQSTETGEVYTAHEMQALCDFAHSKGLKTHLDGARFGQAVAALQQTPAELSWKLGIDVLVFGGTKGGCMGVEAVIFFDKALAHNFELKRKRAGHLTSKHRFLAAQMRAFLASDHWLDNARHANHMAKALSSKFKKLAYPVEVNAVFPILSDEEAAHLRAQGVVFYAWPCETPHTYRFVTSFLTTQEDLTFTF
jgi:threonine aldolase